MVLMGHYSIIWIFVKHPESSISSPLTPVAITDIVIKFEKSYPKMKNKNSKQTCSVGECGVKSEGACRAA
jgi:hypothetical protein